MQRLTKTPINTLITVLTSKKGSPITFDDLKNELTRTDENDEPVYHVNIKENDDTALIYYDSLPEIIVEDKQLVHGIEDTCRSYVMDKTTLLPISSQFNRIIYNIDALNYLKTVDWKKNVVVQPCYEGTMITVFYHNEWFVSTRRCLDAGNSKWIKDLSYKDLFEEAMVGKFTYDDLNKDFCYHFVLVHYKNRNIVTYSNLEEEYREIYHILTTKKYTLEEVEHTLNTRTVETLEFDGIDDAVSSLSKINIHDIQNKSISLEGYVLKVYDGEKHKSPFTVLKLQTDIYQEHMHMKPNNSNSHQGYLELYQCDLLAKYLPYHTPFANEVIQRYNNATKTISKEILDLYHCTRQKRNAEVYENLTDIYRKVLYDIHGIYIKHRSNDYKKRISGRSTTVRSINVHDVYHHLKHLQPHELRQIFYDRRELEKDPRMIFINSGCIYTKTVIRLMFGPPTA